MAEEVNPTASVCMVRTPASEAGVLGDDDVVHLVTRKPRQPAKYHRYVVE